MRTWTVALSALLAGLAADAAELTLTVTEHLNRHWRQELVSFPFQAKEKQCVAESLALRGPAGPVAVQLTEVELWPNTAFVKSGQVWFTVAELPPLAEQAYTLTYGPAPSSAAVPTDLNVTSTETQVELTTTAFGVRLPLGAAEYAEGKPLAGMPSPVLALRLADGTWFGQSAWTGLAQSRRTSSKLVASGPVMAIVQQRYELMDGTTWDFTIKLAAGDYAVQVRSRLSAAQPDLAWDLTLGGLQFAAPKLLTGGFGYAKEIDPPPPADPAGPAFYLSPWPGDGWFRDCPALIRFPLNGKPGDLQLSLRDAGDWVPPQTDFAWQSFAKWDAPMVPFFWQGWQQRRLPIYLAGGVPRLHVNGQPGVRSWTLGHAPSGDKLVAIYRFAETGAWTPRPRLADLQRLTLAWPEPRGKTHPWLYAPAGEFPALANRDPRAAQDLTKVERLRELLNLLGALDLMRGTMDIAARYDAVMGTAKLEPRERQLLRAQMAFVTAEMRNPLHWSFERGFISGNPNMTASRICNFGLMACALRDHPEAKQWAQYAIDWAQYWLEHTVDETGYWPESSHYARVSVADLLQLAIVTRQAGYHDFFQDPKFLRLLRFYEETTTPPDPMRTRRVALGSGAATNVPVRACAPYGRGTRGDVWGLNGLAAAATAASHPEFSRVMQWCYRQSGYCDMISHAVGGYDRLFTNPLLPEAAPTDWVSTRYPHLGYLLRSHVGTAGENYLLWLTEPSRNSDGEIWAPDTGSVSKWFAGGVPMGGLFRRLPETSHRLFQNQVMPAATYDPAKPDSAPVAGYRSTPRDHAMASLPRLDYAAATFTVAEPAFTHYGPPEGSPAFPPAPAVGQVPLEWRRQALLVSDDLPGGVDYLVLRDTVLTDQPTQWHFWSLTQKLGTPAETADREAFLKDAPGAKAAPFRELQGDRLTGLGQFARDLEYYLASPTRTPRYTLRFGTRGGAYGMNNFDEFQDLLQLRLPGRGSYFVALFPRPLDGAAPQFTTHGDGRIIRLAGSFGTDFAFLSEATAEAKAGDAVFTGTAASIQDRPSGLLLALGAAGEVRYGDYALICDQPATLRAGAQALAIRLAPGVQAATVTFRAPEKWQLAPGMDDAELTRQGRDYRLQLRTPLVTLVRQ